MEFVPSPEAMAVIDSYPAPVQKRVLVLRDLIVKTAEKTDGVERLEETLKWGEPSYAAKSGSPVRLGWKASQPDHYAMYFHCGTTLVETFRELFGDELRFEGERAIVFEVKRAVPKRVLKECVTLALTYHRRKHLPMLGA